MFDAPATQGELQVTAILTYQKADAGFLDKLFGKEAGIRTPITTISKDTLSIRVEQ